MAEACPLALPTVWSHPMASLAGPQNGQCAAHTAVQALPHGPRDTSLLPRPPGWFEEEAR